MREIKPCKATPGAQPEANSQLMITRMKHSVIAERRPVYAV
jgi:hypothetical protein